MDIDKDFRALLYQILALGFTTRGEMGRDMGVAHNTLLNILNEKGKHEWENSTRKKIRDYILSHTEELNGK